MAVGEPALDARRPAGDAGRPAAVGAQHADSPQRVERGARHRRPSRPPSVSRRPASTTRARTAASVGDAAVGSSSAIHVDVAAAGREHVDGGVGVAALDRRGELGDGAAEAVHVAQHDDAAGDRRRRRRCVGHEGRADDVAEHGAGLDGGQLVGVADEDQAGVGARRRRPGWPSSTSRPSTSRRR